MKRTIGRAFMRHVMGLCLALCCLVNFSGCLTEEVPITGRRSLSLVPASQLRSMSLQQYNQFLQKNKLSSDAQATAMVKRVGAAIQRAVEQHFADQGWSDRLQDYAWEFNLIENDQKNAFCMPGGKVAVYTGILPITQTEAGLAAVVGHEAAHAIAEHSRERMSQALLVSLGGAALGVAMQNQESRTRNVFLGLYGAGSSVGYLLPNSRQQEAEADRLGLIFMALAGYDPHAAVGVWERMAAASKGKQPPAFLSTHPTNSQRIAQIRSYLPEALQYYRQGTASSLPQPAPEAIASAEVGGPRSEADRLRAENEAMRRKLGMK